MSASLKTFKAKIFDVSTRARRVLVECREDSSHPLKTWRRRWYLGSCKPHRLSRHPCYQKKNKSLLASKLRKCLQDESRRTLWSGLATKFYVPFVYQSHTKDTSRAINSARGVRGRRGHGEAIHDPVNNFVGVMGLTDAPMQKRSPHQVHSLILFRQGPTPRVAAATAHESNSTSLKSPHIFAKTRQGTALVIGCWRVLLILCKGCDKVAIVTRCDEETFQLNCGEEAWPAVIISI